MCCNHHKIERRPKLFGWVAVFLLMAAATVIQYHHHDSDGRVCMLWSDNHAAHDCDDADTSDDACELHFSQMLIAEGSEHETICQSGHIHRCFSECYALLPLDLKPQEVAVGLYELQIAPDRPVVPADIDRSTSRRGPPEFDV